MIKSAHINILEDAITALIAGTEDPDFPLYRLYDRNPGKLFKGSAAETTIIKVDQGLTPEEIDRLLIPAGHNLDELQGTHFHPSSIVINTGTYITGNVADVQAVDQVYYQTREVVGAPGFDIEAEWTGLPQQISAFHFVGRYEGNPAHNIYAEVYNENTMIWDRFTALSNDFPSGSVDYNLDWTLPGPIADYYAGSAGNWSIKIRFRHITSGVPTHNFYIDFLSAGDSFELVVEFSDDDITYSPAVVCIPETNDEIDCPFLAATHRYWKLTFNTPDEPPELAELFLTSTYSWIREANLPEGPLEDVTNSVKDITPSGSHRAVILGINRWQRIFLMRIQETDKNALVDLFNTVGLATPFWIDDNGTFIYVRFREVPDFTKQAVNVYTGTVNIEEVIDG